VNDLESSGGKLPLWVQLPTSALLLVILLLALRMVNGRNARFVIFACWLRFMLSAFHDYTFPKILAGLSINAAGSLALFGLGLLVLPRALLLSKAIMSTYLLVIVIIASAYANHMITESFEPVIKFGLLIVIALNCYQALRIEDERRFGLATLLSFAPLLVFQALSLVLNVAKTDAGTDVRNYIGGYNHEAAFSVALFGLFIAAAVSRSMPRGLRFAIVPIAVVSIMLANYRTAILAMAPLIIYYLLFGISRFVGRSLRPLVVAVSGFALVLMSATAIVTLDRFSELRTIAQGDQPLIQPPDQFTISDRALLNGRSLIWSSYYYKWKEDGGQVEHLIGFGPNSWETYFKVYAHNSFVDFLFEYGILGVITLCLVLINGLAMAWRTGAQRWTMVSAHLSFLVLNLATLPMWQVEGLILYGLLMGYTMFYRLQGKTKYRRVEHPIGPALVT
jgi:hypothetical protein